MTNLMTECPVCGRKIRTGNLIFHMRKTAVFEVYNAYKEGTLERAMRGDITLIAPHESYIQNNSTTKEVFTM